MPSTYAVCREILHNGADRNPPISDISPMKLIKLAFLSHGFHIAYVDKPLFNDDIVAWQYGPVIPSIYFKVNHYRSKPIRSDLFDGEDEPLDDDAKKVIDAVMNTYGRHEALELSTITHMKDSPWAIAIKENGPGAVISESVIRKYYKGVVDGDS